ncbi:hypothetical protein SeMB42_g01383 [Synchytrium endobioticum]|nr:hypothetical protein SeMB42_g01383 [Synchytrium endobioticum]
MESVVKQRDWREENDYRRAFYRHEMGNLTDLLIQLHSQLTSELSTGFNSRHVCSVLEVNNIFHLILANASAYRQSHIQIYGLDLEHPPIELWTGTNDVQTLLQAQFEATLNVITQLERSGLHTHPQPTTMMSSGASPLAKLKRQLCKLAEMIYGATASHNVYLNTHPSGTRQSAMEIETIPQVRKSIVYALFEIGCADDAYQLSEKYRDVETLSDLCIRRSDAQTRISYYVDTFGVEFTQVLYRLYLNEGMGNQLLNQDPRYDEFVSTFLNQQNVPWLSWIQDVKTRKYVDAGAKLQSVALVESSLSKQSLSLSMSFLSLVSDAPIPKEDVIAVNARKSEVNVLLRLNAMSLSIASDLSDGIPPASRLFLEELDGQRPTMVKLYQRIVQHVVADGPICFDDLVDLLTLTPDGDFDAAMKMALDMFVVPRLRSPSIIKTIWRRAWISDRWPGFVASLGAMSESEMRRQLRQSHAYAVLQCIKERGNEFVSCAKPPSGVLYEVGEGKIQSRNVRLSAEEQDALVTDYLNENMVLIDLISNHKLEQIYEEVIAM